MAAAADIGAITTIYRQAVLEGTGTFEIDPPEEAEMAARHARITGAGHPYLVATDGRQILGYAYAGAFRERQAFALTLEDSVYVRPDAHCRGIGQALLAGLLEAATRGGARQMLALIGDSANRGSIALHERAGFEHVGVLRSAGWKFGRWLDVVVMQRALGQGGLAAPGPGTPIV